MFLERQHLLIALRGQVIVVVAQLEIAQRRVDLRQPVVDRHLLSGEQIERIAQKQRPPIPIRADVQLALPVAGIGQIDENVGQDIGAFAFHPLLVGLAETYLGGIHLSQTGVNIALHVETLGV